MIPLTTLRLLYRSAKIDWTKKVFSSWVYSSSPLKRGRNKNSFYVKISIYIYQFQNHCSQEEKLNHGENFLVWSRLLWFKNKYVKNKSNSRKIRQVGNQNLWQIYILFRFIKLGNYNTIFLIKISYLKWVLKTWEFLRIRILFFIKISSPNCHSQLNLLAP